VPKTEPGLFACQRTTLTSRPPLSPGHDSDLLMSCFKFLVVADLFVSMLVVLQASVCWCAKKGRKELRRTC
jgi:hypothetical protein